MRNRLLDAYLAELGRHLAADPQRDAIVAQARDALEHEARRTLLADSTATLDDAVAAAIEDFGAPSDVARDGASGILRRRSTGRAIAPAASRAPPRAPRVAATIVILAAIALGIAVLAVGFNLTNEVRASPPTSQSTTQRILLQRSDAHQVATQTTTDRFTITDATLESLLTITIQPRQGCAFYTLTDPSGDVVSDSTSACAPQSFQTSPLEVGEYTLDVRLVGYTGTVNAVGTATERAPP